MPFKSLIMIFKTIKDLAIYPWDLSQQILLVQFIMPLQNWSKIPILLSLRIYGH